MNLDEILSRRLLIVSGKGGVGKTSVAASLGLIASRRGKKTLIAEVNAAEKISGLFGLGRIGYQEKEIAPRLFAINVDPRSAFEEYVVEQIHSERIYRLVFENRFVRSFLDATPGLHYLLEIGKIWSLSERDRDETGKKPKYDLVIIDAPATGHGLAFLKVAQVVAEAVRVGPLKTKALEIVKWVKDPAKALLFIVTLAEEMPVNEALELLQSARSSIGIPAGPVLVNAVFPSRFTDGEWKELKAKLKKGEKEDWFPYLSRAIQTFEKRNLLQRFYINKLKLGIGGNDLMEIPYLFRSHFDRGAIEQMAEHLAEALSRGLKKQARRRRAL